MSGRSRGRFTLLHANFQWRRNNVGITQLSVRQRTVISMDTYMYAQPSIYLCMCARMYVENM